MGEVLYSQVAHILTRKSREHNKIQRNETDFATLPVVLVKLPNVTEFLQCFDCLPPFKFRRMIWGRTGCLGDRAIVCFRRHLIVSLQALDLYRLTGHAVTALEIASGPSKNDLSRYLDQSNYCVAQNVFAVIATLTIRDNMQFLTWLTHVDFKMPALKKLVLTVDYG